MAHTISEALQARRRSRGGDPLITYYDLGSGERTELSATTFANWVDKTANLLDELAVASGDVVRLELAHRHPGHWLTLIWTAACWQVGAAVTTIRPEQRVAAVVLGPDWAGYETSTASELIACSLHPLGLGFAESPPTGVTDYALEVRGQPDVWAGSPVPADTLAWIDGHQELTAGEVVRFALDLEDAGGERRLVRPGDAWGTCRDALVRPLVTDGSAVVVVGDDDDHDDDHRIERLRRTERITL